MKNEIPDFFSTQLFENGLGTPMIEDETLELLVKLTEKYRDIAERMSAKRPLLDSALQKNQEELQRFLKEEEDNEREADRQYWKPLREELEAWRLGKAED